MRRDLAGVVPRPGVSHSIRHQPQSSALVPVPGQTAMHISSLCSFPLGLLPSNFSLRLKPCLPRSLQSHDITSQSFHSRRIRHQAQLWKWLLSFPRNHPCLLMFPMTSTLPLVPSVCPLWRNETERYQQHDETSRCASVLSV